MSDDEVVDYSDDDDGYDDDAGVHQVLQFSSDDDEEDTQVRPISHSHLRLRFPIC